jgi:hypothetical protein
MPCKNHGVFWNEVGMFCWWVVTSWKGLGMLCLDWNKFGWKTTEESQLGQYIILSSSMCPQIACNWRSFGSLRRCSVQSLSIVIWITAGRDKLCGPMMVLLHPMFGLRQRFDLFQSDLPQRAFPSCWRHLWSKKSQPIPLLRSFQGQSDKHGFM